MTATVITCILDPNSPTAACPSGGSKADGKQAAPTSERVLRTKAVTTVSKEDAAGKKIASSKGGAAAASKEKEVKVTSPRAAKNK